MPKINEQLFQRLLNKLGVGRSRVYALIDEKVRNAHIPRHLAAIAVAAERGINISKFASSEDLATIRHSTNNAAPAPAVVHLDQGPFKTVGRGKSKGKPRTGTNRRRGTTVFVVHGRDLAARNEVFAFLRSLNLRPLEWTQALKLTKQGSPYVGDVLDAAFREAAAIVVLITPDDVAKLKKSFVKPNDPSYERELTGQTRPNVLFEAGMAFGRNPKSTVLVQIGETRPFSDVGGRHVTHLSDSAASRREFATKLSNAGCIVDTSGTDWLTIGDFKPR
ncbi:MAG: nucleotide-binding protein [Verrucomicrobia bacterium]|nr:nucleotide-binding protein [Verrucomicrobiota bacterium]